MQVNFNGRSAGRISGHDPRERQLQLAQRVLRRTAVGAAGRVASSRRGLPDPQERRLGVVRGTTRRLPDRRPGRRRWGASVVVHSGASASLAAAARRAEQPHRAAASSAPPSLAASLDLRQVTVAMGFLADKKILITGVLSNRSIAYGVARACQREGAAARVHLRQRRAQGARRQDRRASSATCRSCAATSRGRRHRRAVRRAQGGVGRARRPAAFDRLRAARGARRRLPRRACRGRRSRPRTTSRATASRRSPRARVR